jgi:hypothetical protein
MVYRAFFFAGRFTADHLPFAGETEERRREGEK